MHFPKKNAPQIPKQNSTKSYDIAKTKKKIPYFNSQLFTNYVAKILSNT
jgi:hypothetical protein